MGNPAARPPIQQFAELDVATLRRLQSDPRMGAAAQDRINARILELEGGGRSSSPTGGRAALAAPAGPSARRGSHQTGVMNQTEAAFLAEVLAPRAAAGASERVLFERVQWWIAPGLTYRPDYVEVLLGGAWWNWEVKGGRIEEDARVKFKAAAEAYPWMRWTMVQRTRLGQPWTLIYDRGATELGTWPDRIQRKT